MDTAQSMMVNYFFQDGAYSTAGAAMFGGYGVQPLTNAEFEDYRSKIEESRRS